MTVFYSYLRTYDPRIQQVVARKHFGFDQEHILRQSLVSTAGQSSQPAEHGHNQPDFGRQLTTGPTVCFYNNCI